ncbi:hypothetical protein M422DRAFT_25815, partial [Sphaerobolus stellatus SS14]
RYAVMDASQGWFMFWISQAFSVLGAGFDPQNRQRAINTILASQHPEGGFGGGPQQAPHLLPTYASVCALAIVGRSGPGGGWDEIDRKRMYDFFMSLKQPDGSFRVARDAEVDIRGTYCALVVATLLNFLTPSLVEGIPGFIRSCQTYEGGFSSSSQPYYGADGSLLPSPRPPLGEAHGGYTSCALGSWLLLKPLMAENEEPINVKSTLRWLAKMQGSGMDLGGFRGRTNKLVDGCYSWWVGGCFALLDGLSAMEKGVDVVPMETETTETSANDGEWDDVEDDLYDTKALQEYILYAAQDPDGGMRDKPYKHPDAYHTLYVLAGLSSAQHQVRPAPLDKQWKDQPDDVLHLDASESPERRNARRKAIFESAYRWKENESKSRILGGIDNRVNATHPLFNLTTSHSRAMLCHFYGQDS